MTKATILHLADIHYDDSLHNEITHAIKNIRDDILERKITPDCICLCGDISKSGQPSQLSKIKSIINNELLSPLKISAKNIFFIPGNHDIDRSSCIEALEKQWTSELTSSEAVNSFIKNESRKAEQEHLRSKLAGYNKNFPIDQNNLDEFFCQTGITDCNGFKIGFITINSAWLSSGFGADEGRLLIHLDPIKKAAIQLRDSGANCLVALSHHPHTMLARWNERESRNLFAAHFDLSLFGHFREKDTEGIRRPLGCCTYITSNSAWGGRDRCGYTLIEINNQLRVTARKWCNTQSKFVADDSFGDNGIYIDNDFMLKDENAKRGLAIGRLKQELCSTTSCSDIIVRPFDEIEEVALRDVYVEPLLTHEPKPSDKNQDKIELRNLIESHKNAIIFGRKEYGKTTLLRYIYEQLIDTDDFRLLRNPFVLRERVFYFFENVWLGGDVC